MSLSEIGKKAWRTRKRQNVGREVAEHRRKLMLGVKGLLEQWNRDLEGKEVCVVCGDGVPKTILQRHHVNPYDKSQAKVWLCASCHNIFNKIEETTEQSDVERDLNLRHKKFTYNIQQECPRGRSNDTIQDLYEDDILGSERWKKPRHRKNERST
jgi:hypothetical protein